jgi:hypothetical protein
MRIATYNVEWFSGLFDRQDNLIDDSSWSRRFEVTKSQQLNALGEVFGAIDADAIMIIEAPDANDHHSTVRALENFAAHFSLRTNTALVGFENHTQQEISLLYDPAKLDAHHDPKGRETMDEGLRSDARFDGVFRLDVDVDDAPEKITFSKPPLEVSARTASGSSLRMIGVHAKSKAPHGARNKSEETSIAIANRRKQLAQCIWIRQRVEEHLKAGDDLIVLGDFNDGPGLDSYEKLFGHSGVEIVMGSAKPEPQQLHDPHITSARSRRLGPAPTTSRFYNHKTKTYLNALLDYIMLSDSLFASAAPQWKIWHPFDDPICFQNVTLREALLTASDHFPVTVDLDI